MQQQPEPTTSQQRAQTMPLMDSRGAGFAGLSSQRQQHENEENYLHHVVRLASGDAGIRSQREVGLATGRAGVPAEMTTHAHGIGRRPMSASATPVFRTEALSGGAVAVMEVPQELRPWRGTGRRESRPAAQKTHLDMTLAPQDPEAPGTTRHHGSTFRSTIEGAAMHVTSPHHTDSETAQMASKGQGRRRMQGPPSTVPYELIHPPQANPRALSLSNRDHGPSGAETARTYEDSNHKYREFATRNVAHTNTDTVLLGAERARYPDTARRAVLVAPYGTDAIETPRHGGRRHMAQPSTFNIFG